MENTFFAVINDEGQYSYWQDDQAIPPGWKSVKAFGTKEACIDFIRAEWKDIRPKSLVESINRTNAARDYLEKHQQMKDVYKRRYLHGLDSWSNYDYLKECIAVFFTKYASVLAQKTVFEIGLGSAISSEFILENGFELAGIDIVEHSNWKPLQERYGPSFRPMVEDILLFDSREERFDIVLDNGCFHHFEPELYQPTLDKVHNLLKDDGYFYLAVFEEPNEELAEGHTEYLDGGKRRCKFFQQQEIEQLLLENKFRLRATERVNRNFDNVKTLLCIAQKQ